MCATKILAAYYTHTITAWLHEVGSVTLSRKQHGVTLNFLKSSTHVAQLGIFKNHSLQTISQYHFLKSFDFFKKKKNSKQGKENDVKVRRGIATDRSDVERVRECIEYPSSSGCLF